MLSSEQKLYLQHCAEVAEEEAEGTAEPEGLATASGRNVQAVLRSLPCP